MSLSDHGYRSSAMPLPSVISPPRERLDSNRVRTALTHEATGVTLPSDDALQVFYLMCLTQALEDRLIKLYRQSRFPGGLYSGTGAEAISVTAGYLLNDEDIICPLIRDMGARLAKGSSLETILRGYLGLATGPMRGRDGNIHQGDPDHNVLAMISHLGAMVAVVAGSVWAERQRGRKSIGLTFVGDGATSTGDVHEALNFAAVWKIPLVVVIEDNQFAYSTPVKEQFACETLADRASGYGIPGITVDGTDLVAVHGAMHTMVEHARSGAGPAIVECKTLRFRGHGEHDDNRYMPKDLLAEWQKKEPVARAEKLLLDAELITHNDARAIREHADEQVLAAVRAVEHDPEPTGDQVADGGGAWLQ